MRLLTAAVTATLLAAQTPVTERISASSLRGRVSFLASDALEGRGTPSKGLDIAAEYIASEFRRVGLEPAAGPEYYQSLDYLEVTNHSESLELSIAGASSGIHTIATERVRIRSLKALDLENAPIFKWAPGVRLTGPLSGKVLMLRSPSDRSMPSGNL
jgi:hypothetical protein